MSIERKQVHPTIEKCAQKMYNYGTEFILESEENHFHAMPKDDWRRPKCREEPWVKMETNELNAHNMRQAARLINHRPGRMIQLASLLYCQAAAPQDFGDGTPLTTIESGLLVFIAHNPGITNTMLAEQFGRTKGAISQLTKKLESKDYLVREPNPSDAKSSMFYPTLRGMKLINYITERDFTDNREMFCRMIRSCSLKDLQVFYRMVDTYSVLLMEMLAENRQENAANAAGKSDDESEEQET